MKGRKTCFDIEIRLLTGLSINNGNLLDQASYVVEKGRKCAVIDIDHFIQRIYSEGTDSDKHTLVNALNSTSEGLGRLKAFVSDKYLESDVLYRSSVSGFTESKLLRDTGNLNLNEIYRVILAGKSVPVIPGSSLKGSIRTAFTGQASKLADVIGDDEYKKIKKDIRDIGEQRTARDKDRKANNIEDDIDSHVLFSQSFLSSKQRQLLESSSKDRDKILRDPKYSAMRSLQIFDAFPVSAETELVSLAMPGKKMAKALPIVDAIKGRLMGYESVFKGTMNVSDVTDISHHLTVENIINDCNAFSSKTFSQEQENLIDDLKRRSDDLSFELYDELAGIILGSRKSNEFIIRVGRFSQREYVTYSNDFRYVEKPGSIDDKWGSTRTMIYDGSQYLPMGWCLCSISER